MEHEMNFWDLCVVIGQAIGRLCQAIGRLLARMVRLTYRYWYIVITLVVLAVAFAFYHTRPTNLRYHVQATAFINGASMQQFEQAFAPMQTGMLLPDYSAIRRLMREGHATDFELFRIVDARHDEVADFVDFKRKVTPKDTVQVLMNDRVCIRFCVRGGDIHLIPEIEESLLDQLNGNEALQSAYAVFMPNMKEEVTFNHRQSVKLDSLTSVYYYNAGSTMQMNPEQGAGVNFYGDRKIRLFLEPIYRQQLHTQLGDYKYNLATAPVVLENHFTVDPKPVLGRYKCMLIFFLLAWIGGCLIAQLIDRRQALIAWLKA